MKNKNNTQRMISKLILGLSVVLLTFSFTQAQTSLCKSDFNVSVNQNTKTVTLLARSSHQPAKHAFKLGDGTFLRGDSIVHSYSASGKYKVCMTTIAFNSSTNQRCTTEVCKEVQIVECNRLTANFRYTVEGLTVKLIGVTNSNNVSTGFRFGDGQGARKDEVKHTYDKPGVYEVCYIAEDYTYGCRKEVCKKIIVKDDNKCDLRAKFSFRQSGKDFKFLAKSNADVARYEWSFGDGETATGIETKHTYKKAGKYRVCVTVFSRGDKPGEVCKTSFCDLVIVKKPACDLRADFRLETAGLGVKTLAKANKKGVHYLWIWGDGTDATGISAKHKYAKAGEYEVGLVVVDPVTKCKTCVWKKVIVSKPCRLKADFAIRQADEKIGVSARSNGSKLAKYYWNFGDGTQARGKYAKHKFTKKGVYIVTLTIADRKKGCKLTIQKRVVVGPNPQTPKVITAPIPTVSPKTINMKPEITWDAKVSPSPARSSIKISANNADVKSVKVLSSDGTEVISPRADAELDISLLPPGFYYAHVTATDGSIKVVKFLKS